MFYGVINQEVLAGEELIGCIQGDVGAEEYLTIQELAQRLKLSPKTIRNKMTTGILKGGVHYFSPPGLAPRFKWSAIVAWMEGPSALQEMTARVQARTEVEAGGIPMARGYTLGSGHTQAQ